MKITLPNETIIALDEAMDTLIGNAWNQAYSERERQRLIRFWTVQLLQMAAESIVNDFQRHQAGNGRPPYPGELACDVRSKTEEEWAVHCLLVRTDKAEHPQQ